MDTYANPTPDEIDTLLRRVSTIAVVGLSPKPNRPSHSVAAAMQGFGYRIIPVRPAVDEVLGEPAFANLDELTETPDLVDVFRAPEYVDEIVDSCIENKIGAIWLQEGVINETAAQRARDAGITVIMDLCIYKEYLRMQGDQT